MNQRELNVTGSWRQIDEKNIEFAPENVINELIQRHEVLRTTLKSVDGLPVQVITPDLKITLEPVSLEHLPEVERYGEMMRLTTAISSSGASNATSWRESMVSTLTCGNSDAMRL